MSRLADLRFVETLPVGVRHIRDGVAIPAPSEAALRVYRYILLQGSQDLLYPFWRDVVDRDTGEITGKRSEFRVSVCGRTALEYDVPVYRNAKGGVGIGGVLRCGNVWGCVFCCAKVMRRRAEQIGALFEAVHAEGGGAVMVTFTCAHRLDDSLALMLEKFKSAQRTLSQSRQFRALAESRSGACVATEIKWSPRNGWHPHQHQAWFFPRPLSSDETELLSASLFPVWQSALLKHGLDCREFFKDRRVGVDVRPAWDASEYLAKFDRERDWSLSAEMTAGRLKTGGSQSLTPWAILEDAIQRGRESQAFTLWLEYLRATKGKSCISMKAAAPLLRRFDLPVTFDDIEDANAQGESAIITRVGRVEFENIVKAGGMGKFLEAARSGGAEAVEHIAQNIDWSFS
ncbi:hypothetical protein [Uliginosibacterium sp. 31-12]|uniref:hypothetical protein n=1 Tax=Uliginosibacterium sp. 31-12 TaxID=3062781 RepID=UPI0026E36C6A|nr:hypothetical protein [Uliginosibacterium sp. 31-12]MDO6387649.1 hypothetical protein [Uliginosibacterium sp. 31-12]